jgi:hypothetical protein
MKKIWILIAGLILIMTEPLACSQTVDGDAQLTSKAVITSSTLPVSAAISDLINN